MVNLANEHKPNATHKNLFDSMVIKTKSLLSLESIFKAVSLSHHNLKEEKLQYNKTRHGVLKTNSQLYLVPRCHLPR